MQEEEKEKALTKSRKYQRELEDLEDRAEAAQSEADKLKSKMRSTVHLASSVDEVDCLTHAQYGLS